MKKRLLVCLFAGLMALSFAIPVMAAEVTTAKPIFAEMGYEEISPLNEMTRIYFRIYHGQLQMRVWSITNGRWITDWADV